MKAAPADAWPARKAALRQLGRQRAEGAPALDEETRATLRAILVGCVPATPETAKGDDPKAAAQTA
jgi:hypothetical protein